MRWLPLLLIAGCDPSLPDQPVQDTDVAPPVPFADLAVGEWSYVPMEGMTCGNGTSTGFGVNPGADPTRVYVFFAGGGACWDAPTCHVLKAAVNLETGWGEGKLAAEVAPLGTSGLLDRDDTGSPYRDATWVYVPYCTGDLHAGDKTTTYYAPAGAVHHHGDANIAAVVARLSEELPAVDHAWLTGVSAGGYGVQLQVDRFAAAWPEAELAMLADCAPMVTPYGGRWGTWRSAWDLRQPPGCDGCDASLTAALQAQIDGHPGARFGLTAYDNDGIITLYTGYPLGGLSGATDALVNDVYAPSPAAGVFLVEGNEHTMLQKTASLVGPGGVPLQDWYWSWANGDEGFVDVR